VERRGGWIGRYCSPDGINWQPVNYAWTTMSNAVYAGLMACACDNTKLMTATLDNVVELLVMGGRTIPHVMMMLIPEAWEKDPEMTAEKKAFYEYHGALIEPWDGPASVAFTDGHVAPVDWEFGTNVVNSMPDL